MSATMPSPRLRIISLPRTSGPKRAYPDQRPSRFVVTAGSADAAVAAKSGAHRSQGARRMGWSTTVRSNRGNRRHGRHRRNRRQDLGFQFRERVVGVGRRSLGDDTTVPNRRIDDGIAPIRDDAALLDLGRHGCPRPREDSAAAIYRSRDVRDRYRADVDRAALADGDVDAGLGREVATALDRATLRDGDLR